MPRPCSICHHPQRRRIKQTHDGGATYSAISAEFGVSPAALSRHFGNAACLARWATLECSEEPIQAREPVENVRIQRVAGEHPRAVSRARMRETVVPQTPTADMRVQPASLTAKVVAFPRVAAPETSEREPQLPSLQNLSRLFDLGYTDDQVAEQFGLGSADMSTYINDIAEAKRAVLSRPANDWAATLVCSCMARLARYRRRLEAAEIGLRHRDVDRYEDKIAAAEIQLTKLLKELGIFGRMDFADLDRDNNGMADIFEAVTNSINGVFQEPRSVDLKRKPLLR